MNAAYVDTNFQRLLIKCEELAEKQDLNNWRFEKVLFNYKKEVTCFEKWISFYLKYVLSLEEMLKKLTQLTSK